MRVGITSSTLRWLALHDASDGSAAVQVDDDGILLERDGTRIRWSELSRVTLDDGCHLVDDAGREIRLSPALDHYSELVTYVFRHAAHRRASTASLPHVIHLPRRAADGVLVVLLGLPGLFASTLFALSHSHRTGVALALATLLWMAWAYGRRFVRIELDHGRFEVLDAWGRRARASSGHPLSFTARGRPLLRMTDAQVELFAHAALARGEVLARPPVPTLPQRTHVQENELLIRTLVFGVAPLVSMGLFARYIRPDPDPTRLVGEEIAAAISATPTELDRAIAVLLAVATGAATITARGAIRWSAVAIGASLGLAIVVLRGLADADEPTQLMLGVLEAFVLFVAATWLPGEHPRPLLRSSAARTQWLEPRASDAFQIGGAFGAVMLAAAPLTRVAWAPGYALMPWMFASAVAAPWLAHDLVRAEHRRTTGLLGLGAGAFLLVGRHAQVTLMVAALVAIAISLLPLAGARRTPLRPHAALAHYAAMLCVAVYVASTSTVWLPAVAMAVAVMPIVVLGGRAPQSADSPASGLSSRVRHPDEDGATVSPL
ncbi:MAG: hypothetical protein J0L92_20645 [Deltaproteobacteria bacterium]|nr:hypothetical protein [Deltaproteobacteria bacterium]